MPQILDVRSAGGRSPLAELVFDDGDRLRLHPRRLGDLGLRAGAELTDDDLAAVERLALADDCEQRALRLLATRSRSTAELARRMVGWGLTPVEAEVVVDQLARVGVIDDDAFAGALSDQLRRRGHGHLRARADLERHGFARAAVGAVAQAHAQGDADAALAMVDSRFGPPPYDEATIRRAAGLLARRGFDEDTVGAVLGLPD
jgi:regulatory protein